MGVNFQESNLNPINQNVVSKSGGSKLHRKWKGAARTRPGPYNGGKSRSISGQKRSGSPCNSLETGKRSREDGEFSSDNISNFNTPHSVEVVVDSWGSVTASSLKEIVDKIQPCSSDFASWNKSVYGSLGLKIIKKRNEVSAWYHSALDRQATSGLNDLLSELIKNKEENCEAEREINDDSRDR
ncbi:hypothetical protein COLO4_06768 [Corchorus olitorius]|uniref:Uncharacterized protein n=1 Tax=Corchorus olitorius TaxID=93759 RepID=A0A1R3KM05_9ROSI|nr:hypothetical protein COLO4_06768 [Corchorus olitorius]